MKGENTVDGKKNSDVDCWEPRYGNDSRPWLLGFSEDTSSPTTTTHDTYTGYHLPAFGVEGVRKKLMRKAFWEETKKEIDEELSREEAPSVTTTHYNECFVKEGFIPSPMKIDPELHHQYPLYGDKNLSLWAEKLPNLPGATRAPHIQHRFRRYAGFTKPVDQVLDDFLDPK